MDTIWLAFSSSMHRETLHALGCTTMRSSSTSKNGTGHRLPYSPTAKEVSCHGPKDFDAEVCGSLGMQLTAGDGFDPTCGKSPPLVCALANEHDEFVGRVQDLPNSTANMEGFSPALVTNGERLLVQPRTPDVVWCPRLRGRRAHAEPQEIAMAVASITEMFQLRDVLCGAMPRGPDSEQVDVNLPTPTNLGQGEIQNLGQGR